MASKTLNPRNDEFTFKKKGGRGVSLKYNSSDNYDLPNEFTGCSQIQFLAIFAVLPKFTFKVWTTSGHLLAHNFDPTGRKFSSRSVAGGEEESYVIPDLIMDLWVVP